MDDRVTDHLHGREGDGRGETHTPKTTEAKADKIQDEVATTLIPFTSRHITDEYISWLNDPKLMRYSEQRHRTHTWESCCDYVWSMEHDILWAVFHGDEHVGNISAHTDRNNQVADISILIGRPERGIGTKALGLACEELKKREIRLLTLGMMYDNDAMLKIALKNDFTIYGVIPRYFQLEDGTSGRIIMSRPA
jgi:ribosomal-protein-alanine N-acetyltransferase